MKKRFGQHLLVDKSYLNKIINYVELTPDDVVIEIGSGSGNLTKLLSEKVNKVYAVEIERDILKELKSNIKRNKLSNVEIIEKDFLKLDLMDLYYKSLNSLLSPSAEGGPASGGQSSALKVVGNIPYNITSQILLKLFGEIDSSAPHLKFLKSIYLMLQLEVANRIVAVPGTKAYSPLTILVQYFSIPKILFEVSRRAFYPRPEVDSAFVVLDVRNKIPRVKDSSLLKNIIRTGFQQRRKKIINSLCKLSRDKNTLETIFDNLNIKSNLRAEDLNIQDFINISDYFTQIQAD